MENKLKLSEEEREATKLMGQFCSFRSIFFVICLSFQVSDTVITPNKGQPIFRLMGSNKGTFEIPLFTIIRG